MRAARTNDIWRRLFRRNDRLVAGVRVQYEGVLELGSGELSFTKPLNLVCGENGVGKSAAIWLLARALNLDTYLDGVHKAAKRKASTGLIVSAGILVSRNGSASELQVDEALRELSGQDDGKRVFLLDAGLEVPHILNALRADANPQDLINGVAHIELSDADLSKIKELAGKDYQAVRIHEVEGYANFDIFPFVSVDYGGATYTARDMGLGEFALLYSYWRLRSIPEHSIVLVEEPESFAAPRSQRAFIDYLAELCDARGHLAIVSSHSGVIAERFPNDAIRLCSRVGANVAFTSNPAPSLLVDRLALYLRRRLVVLVEDDTARAFIKALLEHVDLRFAADVDVLVSGSESEVATALKSIRPDHRERSKLVGVLDGDQREKLPKNPQWPIVCLPGSSNPDTDLRIAVQGSNPTAIAQMTGIAAEAWITALGNLEGLNHHDWTPRLAASLGLSLDELCRRLVPVWKQTAGNAVEEFSKELRTAFGLS